MSRSVRFRVTLVATLAVAVVLTAASVGLVLSQQRALTGTLEETLDQQATEIGASLSSGAPPDVLQVAGDDDALAQVVSSSGEVLAATAGAADVPTVVPPLPEDEDRAVTTLDGLVSDPTGYLVVSRSADGPDGLVTVIVASPLDDIAESTSTLARSLSLGVPVVVLLLAGLIWWLVGRTLRPVEAIRAEVGDIGGSDLHRRVPVPSSGDEVAQLATTMNGMLDRLERSSERESRFVADASHELRTPLTRMRTVLGVDLAHPSGADLVATHRSALEEVATLQALVDDLLLLARSAASALIASDPIELDELVRDEVNRLAPREGLRIDVEDVAPVHAVGDAGQLVRVVRNLLENAVRHARSSVVVAAVEQGSEVVLTVDDDGPGIPPGQRAAVFERFTRLDESRTASAGGAGLGLAIVADVVARHGGTVQATRSPAGGARFEVRLPTSRPH